MGLAADLLLSLQSIFDRYGVPRYIWESIAHMETGGSFDPNTKNVNMPGQTGYDPKRPSESSWGLFQLNTNGGQGASFANNPQTLLDPLKNAEIAAPEIARAYYAGIQKGYKDGPDLAGFVAANSGHPGYGLSLTDPAVSIVRQVAPKYMATPIAGSPSSSSFYGTDKLGRTMGFQEWLNALISAPWSEVGTGYLYGFKDGRPRTYDEFQADYQKTGQDQAKAVVVGVVDSAKNALGFKDGIPPWLILVAIGVVAVVFLMGGTFGLVNGKEG